MGLGTALSIGGSVLGAMGNKKQGANMQQLSVFDSLPEEVKNIWMKSYIPATQKEFDRPYEAVPMKRYITPSSDPFYSQGMADMQAFSDTQGGLFTPMYNPNAQTGGGDDAAAKAALDAEMQAMRDEMIGRQIAAGGMRGADIATNPVSGSVAQFAQQAGMLSPQDYAAIGRFSTGTVKKPADMKGIDTAKLSPFLAQLFGKMK